MRSSNRSGMTRTSRTIIAASRPTLYRVRGRDAVAAFAITFAAVRPMVQAIGGGEAALRDLGLDRAGFDDDDLDPEFGDFTAQRITDGLEGELRPRVWTIGRHRHLAADGTDVHNGPRAAQQIGKSAWVIATWPNRLTSNRRRHSVIGRVSTGALIWKPALLISARRGRRRGSRATRSAMASTCDSTVSRGCWAATGATFRRTAADQRPRHHELGVERPSHFGQVANHRRGTHRHRHQPAADRACVR